ncbi:hypothetical protein [Bifidobacterium phasiani]|uniref:Terminase n=1 Tax=Bifidobacterium phasiani TaxID=2834431 RepID=A0ABS6WBA5_9BIFI|nr:hypothetical protein [Bifidobacterium phasiani]MBW3083800.1 hypothetical protein [Bifidobacterium phasiani]
MSDVQPRYCSGRDPSLPTDGPAVGVVSEALGHPLIPWQRLVADIAGEYRVDEQGRKVLAHPRVVVTVPRQAGKTTVDEAGHIRSLLMGPNRIGWYVAQRGTDAVAHFKQVVKDVEASPALRPLIADVKYTAGDMGLWLKNGSVFKPSPPTDSSGHGFQGDRITLDEAWAFNAQQGGALLQAFVPTTITRLQLTGQQPQLWIMSTEGTADSTFLNPLLSECRRGQCPDSWAVIDYGLPLDADPEDLDAVWASHPGAGHLFTRRQLRGFRDEFRNDPAGWRRAFCNIRDDGALERVYTDDIWQAGVCDGDTPDMAHAALGVAVDIDQAATSIVVAWTGRDGIAAARLLRHIPGTIGAADMVAGLAEPHGLPVWLDRKGPASIIADQLAAYHPDTRIADMTAADMAATGPSMLDLMRNQAVRHHPSPALDKAVGVAVRRWSGDTWYLDRRQSPGDISPVEAMQLAVWGCRHLPPTHPVQVF